MRCPKEFAVEWLDSDFGIPQSWKRNPMSERRPSGPIQLGPKHGTRRPEVVQSRSLLLMDEPVGRMCRLQGIVGFWDTLNVLFQGLESVSER